MRALLYREHRDAWKKTENERRNVICSQQQSFRASSVFFCLGYITRPYLRPNVSWRLPVRMRIFHRRVNFFSGGELQKYFNVAGQSLETERITLLNKK